MVLLAGCAHYRPQPLTHAAVAQPSLAPDWAALRTQANEIHHPLLRPIELDPDQGISPDGVAVLTVLLNPALRAVRDQRGLAAAQLLQAGILPNPQLSANVAPVVSGGGPGSSFTAFGAGLAMDVQALIQRGAKRTAAKANVEAIDLDVAWQEWQAAEAAKVAVYQLSADEAQLALAVENDQRLAENLALVRKAVATHDQTVVELATADAAGQSAHATRLQLEQAVASDRLILNETIGLPPATSLRLRDSALPSQIDPPSAAELDATLESRRLDLLALKRGYESQEATLRASVLGQFPKLSLGVSTSQDNSRVRAMGPTIAFDLPIVDRNQGAIASDKATRQRLFDEYVSRVFAAHSQVARQLADIRALNAQIAAAEAAVVVLQRQVDTYRLAADAHNLDAFSFYSAQGNLSLRRLDVLKLKTQLVTSRVALELAAGRYLPTETTPL
ncbi:MAG: Outer rane efflux protein [Verrucomicrobia bacterium]|nr:Outer rane efflux protein [Verrucomicrobiota bacterium]